MRTRDSNSARASARAKRADRVFDLLAERPAGLCADPSHSACSLFVRLNVNTGRRPQTVPAREIVRLARLLRRIHPEAHYPLRRHLAWACGCSTEAVRIALRAARRA